jgi:hypothetical protein
MAVLGFKPGERGGDRGKAGGEIVAMGAQEARPRAGLVELQAPPVEFHLM